MTIITNKPRGFVIIIFNNNKKGVVITMFNNKEKFSYYYF